MQNISQITILSDMTLACGKSIDPLLLLPPTQESASQHGSSYTFPICKPSEADWRLWQEFWGAATGPAGLLHISLREWLHYSHRLWSWFYCKYRDRLFHRHGETITTYIRATDHSRIRSRQQYCQEGEFDAIPQHCVPANVTHTSEGMVLRRSIGPLLAASITTEKNFWDYL